MADGNPIKRIFDLYTSDLSFDEIERLVKKESAAVYEFYKNEIPRPNPYQNKLKRALIFTRSLFNAFLLKLSAARRIFYLAALIIFLVGLISQNNAYLIFSFLIINVLLAFELADKLVVKDEIELAKKIQNSLMPDVAPENEHFEITAYSEAANEVGGDYFDFIKSKEKDGKTYLVIGDISGKGMAAALYMVRVQAIVHFLIENFSNVKEIMINLKKYFAERLKREFFLTILVASIDKKGKVKFCRAGHTPLLHYRKNESDFNMINPKGIGIGLNDKGIFEKTLELAEIKTKTGDILFFFTDGITETMNLAKLQFGEDRLKKIISENADKPVAEIKEKLLSTIRRFRGDMQSCDDMTMIILKAK